MRKRKRDLRQVLPPGPGAPAALQLLATWKRPTTTIDPGVAAAV